MKLTRGKLHSRALALRELGPLRQLSDRDLDRIANDLDEVEIDPGEVLTREGRVAEDWYVVVQGYAEVAIGGRVVAHVGAGDFVGEMALVSGSPRSATVRAVTPMRVLTAHKSVFAAILERPSVARALLGLMTDRLRRAEGAPDSFTRSSASRGVEVRPRQPARSPNRAE